MKKRNLIFLGLPLIAGSIVYHFLRKRNHTKEQTVATPSIFSFCRHQVGDHTEIRRLDTREDVEEFLDESLSRLYDEDHLEFLVYFRNVPAYITWNRMLHDKKSALQDFLSENFLEGVYNFYEDARFFDDDEHSNVYYYAMEDDISAFYIRLEYRPDDETEKDDVYLRHHLMDCLRTRFRPYEY